MTGWFSELLRDKRHRDALIALFPIAAAIAGGLWVVVTYFVPKSEPVPAAKPPPPPVASAAKADAKADSGSVAVAGGVQNSSIAVGVPPPPKPDAPPSK